MFTTAPVPRPLAVRVGRGFLLAAGYLVGGLVTVAGVVAFAQPGSLDALMARGTVAVVGLLAIGAVDGIRRATTRRPDPIESKSA